MKDLEERTKRFSLAVIKFTAALPKTREADVVARQLLRSAILPVCASRHFLALPDVELSSRVIPLATAVSAVVAGL